MTNQLYYGDNLKVLHRYIADETVNLIYLNPHFKSDQDYNMLSADQDGSRSARDFHQTFCQDAEVLRWRDSLDTDINIRNRLIIAVRQRSIQDDFRGSGAQ